MTARFRLTRATDNAERIIARTLGGCEKLSRAPLQPLEDRERPGLVALAHCPLCNIWTERLCALCEAEAKDFPEHGEANACV